MKYISEIFALNITCSLETCGDWRTSDLNWDNLRFRETDGYIYSETMVLKLVTVYQSMKARII